MQQQICVLRRLWKYGGGAYEPLSGWTVDWTDFSCGNGTSVRYPAFWISRYFGTVHFDIVVTWRNPSNRKIIAKERVDWDKVSNYGCLKPGPYANCQPGVFFRDVAGIKFEFV